MKILLVYPKYPDTFWSFKHVLKFVSKKAAFPPLGLLTVAAMLPADWEKRLVDLNVEKLTDEVLGWADMMFISAMIVQKESAQEIIERCKKLGKKVVAGGPLFSAQPEKFPDVNHLVLGEAENTLPIFLKDLAEGKATRLYQSAERPDITKIPIPLWSLIKFKHYVTIPVQFSRGCPFDCEFCDIVTMYGRIPRTKTPPQLLGELQSLYEAKWRGAVFIVDDNFIGNKKKTKEMLRSLIVWQKKHKYPFKLFTEASVNLADDEELMGMMSAANFHKVFLGIETPNLESLKECGKNQNAGRDLHAAVKKIQQYGMQVMGGFIVGFDNDSEEIFAAQIRFIQETGVVTAMVGMLNALPGTRLWRRLKQEGRLLAEVSGENTDGSINFLPKIGMEKLAAGYKKIIAAIYNPRNYYERIETFVRNYRPTVRGGISFADILALFKSLWLIGIFSKARFYYWKLIIKTCFTKIRALPTAVELAISELHFRTIARKII